MDPLAQLKDIHLPEPVGFWPLAWGWWVLLLLISFAIVVAVVAYRRHQQRNRYRTAARVEIERAKYEVDQDQNVANYLQQISIILRRAALSGCGTCYQANVKGEAWLRWLDSQCPEARNGFSQGPGRALLTGPYEAKPQADVEALNQLVLLWLQKHRNQWQRSPAKTAAHESSINIQARSSASVKKAEAKDA